MFDLEITFFSYSKEEFDMKVLVQELYISFLHRLSEETFKIDEFWEQNHVDCVFHKLVEEW